MRFSGFTECCGIDIVSGFGTLHGSVGDLKTIKENIRRIVSGEARREEGAGRRPFPGMYLVAINDEQREAGIGDILYRNGFRRLKTFENPKSDREVHLYGYVFTPPETTPRNKVLLQFKSKLGL